MKLPIATLRLIPIISLIASTGFASLAMAQDTNNKIPAPPYLKRTPDHSVWSVTVGGDINGEGAAAPDSSPNSSEGSSNHETATAIQSRAMKSGDLIYVQNANTQNQVEQSWHFKQYKVTKMSDGSFDIEPDSGGGDIYSVNFQNADFAGLDWLSEQTYAGTVKYQGRDVIVFKQSVTPISSDLERERNIAISSAKRIDAFNALNHVKAPPAPTPPPVKMVPEVAFIDLQTRLPIIVTIGGQKRVYQYSPMTSAIPQAEEVTKAVKDYDLRMNRSQ